MPRLRKFRKPKTAKDLIPNTTKVFVFWYIVGFVIQLSYFNWNMRWRICDRHQISSWNCTQLFMNENATFCENGTILSHDDSQSLHELNDIVFTKVFDEPPKAGINAINLEESEDEEELESCGEIKEKLAAESAKYIEAALLIYCIPVILVVLPTAALLDKFQRGWTAVAMLCGGLTCLTSIIQTILFNKLSPADLVKTVIPAGIIGNEILLKLLAFGQLAREAEIMELFEKCSVTQSAFVGGKFIGSLFMGFAMYGNSWVLILGIIVFAVGVGKVTYAYIRGTDKPPVDSETAKSNKLGLKLTLVFLIVVIYFFAEIGESTEEVEYMEEENSWVLVTFTMYGSITDGLATVSLICVTFFAKLLIEKHAIGKNLVKWLNPATIGLVGVVVDAIVKLMLSFTDDQGAKIASSILAVFGELVIVSGMCLLIHYTPTAHKMKAVSVAVIAEAVGKVGAGLVFRLVHEATKTWFFGFAFIYQLLLLLIPFLSFGYLHLLYLEDEKQNEHTEAHNGQGNDDREPISRIEIADHHPNYGLDQPDNN